MAESIEIIKEKCSSENFNKITQIKNKHIHDFIAKFIGLLDPESVFICDNSTKDIEYIKKKTLEESEEINLALTNHTIHFDGINDQARDKKRTKFLVPKNIDFGSGLNTIDKDEGLADVNNIMSGIMKGKQLLVLFFTLGPQNSPFSIPAVQLTDSNYVAHSESILYRPGYSEFIRLGDYGKFFKFIHSGGELENAVSKNVDRRRIYIDTNEDIVYSANTQYGGNTLGLKKLAMRLGINRASQEDWLTEHMFISGIKGPGQRTTYFAGAFPSMCGKTSTAMLKGETIVGDDIVYIRNIDGKARAVNVEMGLFGIIQDINPDDDPIIWEVLNSEYEVIFSNILMTEDGDVFWNGKPGKVPEQGTNYSGKWFPGKTDKEGTEVKSSHKNARFTTSLKNLSNLDPRYDDPQGVEIGGLIYGGRDSDTWVPVFEAYDWTHGIITTGASLESETTAATLGKTGIRAFNPMSNIDFISIPFGKYVEINIEFGSSLDEAPKIFGVNYFLKGENGEYLNSKLDKMVWLKWMELRAHGEASAVDAGIGSIPEFEDLKDLFKKVLGKDYTEKDYIDQFTLRIPENLSKIDRIIKIYTDIGKSVPEVLFKILDEQKSRLSKLASEKGDYISPFDL